MWRDVFLHNREAVLEMLDRFLTDLAMMREAIRAGDGETMFDLFARTRGIRRSIIELGQDDARPDFGRKHNGDV
jgi:cyclohexadieny/prephenate dehydrogenase